MRARTLEEVAADEAALLAEYGRELSERESWLRECQVAIAEGRGVRRPPSSDCSWARLIELTTLAVERRLAERRRG